MNFKSITAIALCAIISACGGGGGGSNGTQAPSLQTISVTSLNGSTTLNRDDTYNISVTGTGNTVSVSANNSVNEISVSGTGNTITFAAPAKVASIKLTGLNNVVSVPKGTKYTTDNTGLGNSITEY